ncbi:Holliday junction branch migration protein RuvA [Litorivicinus sp.]|jgi:Holliday junction DNA helicase RuvA|nr:Holliday junction branch migration protein RuvA [Litorivicinus sp.]MDC1240366.1 Holliday junction branch migration protein RuvA [Litorivicinus sp.]|tara:strand:- start:2934 stop:3518 length:585 start_codon:yes stop_codon:yes gene_type:complete
MIGRITGIVLGIEQQQVVIDVQGIGYELECPISTLCELPPKGEIVTLFSHFVVREDAQLLYGFLRSEDRECFRILIKISGVGPKLAVGILSGLSGGELAQAIEGGDLSTLTRLPGVGKKTAERLVVELRGRLSLNGLPLAAKEASASDEAVLGLVSLGYKESEARKVIDGLSADTVKTPEALIRASLKVMMGSG